VDAFTSKPQIRTMHVRHIPTLPLVKEKEETAILLTTEAYKRLQLFKKYMDSLRIDKDGKRIYDSILLARPGMMDSVAVLEKMYLKQQN